MLPKEQNLPHQVLLESCQKHIRNASRSLLRLTLESLESATLSINRSLHAFIQVSQAAPPFQSPRVSPVPGHNVSPGLRILWDSCYLVVCLHSLFWDVSRGKGH